MVIRIVKNLRQEGAVSLMANCSPHITPAVIELLSISRLHVVTFTPRTTQIFQISIWLCLAL
jgi:hypothetical protein